MYSPNRSPNSSPRRTRGSQCSKESAERDAPFEDDTVSEEEYDFHIEDLIS